MERIEILYDGIVWVKQKNGYYQSTTRKKGRKNWLHQYVYEKYNGKQPIGFAVHHKDFNKDNNDIDNLELIDKKEHASMHSILYFADDEHYKKQLELLNRVRPDHVWPTDEKEKEIFHQRILLGMKNVKPITRNCDYCGKEYSVMPYGKNRFCCSRCKNLWKRRSGIYNVVKICPVCGKEFTTNKYDNIQTCSRSCGYVLRWRTINDPKYKESKNKVN